VKTDIAFPSIAWSDSGRFGNSRLKIRVVMLDGNTLLLKYLRHAQLLFGLFFIPMALAQEG
jgi:hypothetical protein